MTTNPSQQSPQPVANRPGPVIRWLERMDNWAHVVVAAFFILMATTVVIHMGFIFLRQLPLIIPSTSSLQVASHETTDPFVANSLELLSNILFVVILLELLRTIITYLETHDIQAIMQEFLVVGVISSVRKILLVGAEASLHQGATQTEFIQEATGVVIDIIGILLLIGGLIALKRTFGSKAQKELQQVKEALHAPTVSGESSQAAHG